MTKARVFRSNNSQAARPAQEFHSKSHQAEISRQGDDFLRESPMSAVGIFDALAAMTSDFMKQEHRDTPPQKRGQVENWVSAE